MQFYNVGPEKNELLGSCHRFQEIFNLAKQFSKKTQKNRSMPMDSDLGQLKPKWIKMLALK